MPSYEYLHKVEHCNHEWEEWRSISKCMPSVEDKCPKCGETGNIELLISGGNGKGKVVLTGRELIDKTNADAQDLARQVYSDEATYANILGESKYQNLQSKMDKQRR